MMRSLVGCKSIEKVLFFLLVNGKCYAHQLKQMLDISLTPVQKALARLEKGGVVSSHYEGKVRIYQFNSTFPLMDELELLLRKAYHHLPIEQKKAYDYYTSERSKVKKRDTDFLQTVWNQMQNVSRMTLLAKSCTKGSNRWLRKGVGEVEVNRTSHTIIFNEKGKWQLGDTFSHQYSNRYRWTWNSQEEMITLEHLRFGLNNPVFLFHLVPHESNLLKSLHPHLCGEDTYYGWLKNSDLFLQMYIRTIGPKKNEEIEYIYT